MEDTVYFAPSPNFEHVTIMVSPWFLSSLNGRWIGEAVVSGYEWNVYRERTPDTEIVLYYAKYVDEMRNVRIKMSDFHADAVNRGVLDRKWKFENALYTINNTQLETTAFSVYEAEPTHDINGYNVYGAEPTNDITALNVYEGEPTDGVTALNVYEDDSSDEITVLGIYQAEHTNDTAAVDAEFDIYSRGFFKNNGY